MTVPNMVKVYRIRYIQSHNASGKLKLFEIFNCQITEKCKFLLQVFYENIILHTKEHSTEYKTVHYSIHEVPFRRLINYAN